MIEFNRSEVVWVEKYRPSEIDECILPEKLKNQFLGIVKNNVIPNMMFFGPPGCGKTTTAKALCKQMDIDWMIINISSERGIDTLRDKITSFASTVSLGYNDGRKCVILDEFDGATPILQSALRAAQEEFSSNCAFIMTCNYPNRIIDALHSRFTPIDFSMSEDEKTNLQARFFKRVNDILKNEDVEFELEPLVHVVQKYFPDNRRILNVLQQYASASNKIDSGILLSLDEISIDSLVKSIKDKKFKEIAQWAENNKNVDTSNLYENLYRSLKTWVENSSIPDAILILHEYQKCDTIVPSKELHLVAMCVELMSSIEMK